MTTESVKKSTLKEKAAKAANTLAGDFGIMMVAIFLANIIHYLYSLVMNRMLGKASFGDLYSLLSIFLIATMGVMSIQTVITKYIADFEALGEHGNIRLLVKLFSRWLLLTGVVILLAGGALAWPLFKLLKLDSPWFIVILASSIAATFYLTLPLGILQGKQQFIKLGGANIANAVLRLISGMILVWLGMGVYGALGAGLIAAVLVAGFIMYFFRDLLSGEAEQTNEFHPVETLKYMLPVVLTMFFVILLTQIDVVIVKAVFSRTDAGLYSYAALAGKAVMFLPEGISMVMFPKVSEMRAKGEPTRKVLLFSLSAVVLIVGAAAAFYAIFPGFTAQVFAGGKGKEVVNLIGLFGFSMAMYSVVKLLAYYHLALERKGFILFFVAGAIVQIGGIILFHNSLMQVVVIMNIVAGGLMLANLILALKERA